MPAQTTADDILAQLGPAAGPVRRVRPPAAPPPPEPEPKPSEKRGKGKGRPAEPKAPHPDPFEEVLCRVPRASARGKTISVYTDEDRHAAAKELVRKRGLKSLSALMNQLLDAALAVDRGR